MSDRLPIRFTGIFHSRRGERIPGMGLGDLLTRTGGKPVSLEHLRVPAGAAAGCALVTMLFYRSFLAWCQRVEMTNDLFVYDWMIAVLTFLHVNAWAPQLAFVGFLGLGISAAATGWLTEGRGLAARGAVASGATSFVSVVPLLLALAIGAATVAFVIAAGTAILAVILWMAVELR